MVFLHFVWKAMVDRAVVPVSRQGIIGWRSRSGVTKISVDEGTERSVP
jgi:hypothetical protein